MTAQVYFFQISVNSFLEASPIVDHPTKTHGLRIVSINSGKENFIHLQPVNLTELKTIMNTLGLRHCPFFQHFDQVRAYWRSLTLY